LAFSAGGDGGGRSPEYPARNPHASFAAASDCRTIAIYGYAALGRVLINAQIAAPAFLGHNTLALIE